MIKLFQTYNSICSKYNNENELVDLLFSFLTEKPLIKNTVDDFLYKNLKNGKNCFLYRIGSWRAPPDSQTHTRQNPQKNT